MGTQRNDSELCRLVCAQQTCLPCPEVHTLLIWFLSEDDLTSADGGNALLPTNYLLRTNYLLI